jgi:hypothetical protein
MQQNSTLTYVVLTLPLSKAKSGEKARPTPQKEKLKIIIEYILKDYFLEKGTRPDRPWGPPSPLYNEYRIPFPGVKRPGRGTDPPIC